MHYTLWKSFLWMGEKTLCFLTELVKVNHDYVQNLDKIEAVVFKIYYNSWGPNPKQSTYIHITINIISIYSERKLSYLKIKSYYHNI